MNLINCKQTCQSKHTLGHLVQGGDGAYNENGAFDNGSDAGVYTFSEPTSAVECVLTEFFFMSSAPRLVVISVCVYWQHLIKSDYLLSWIAAHACSSDFRMQNSDSSS